VFQGRPLVFPKFTLNGVIVFHCFLLLSWLLCLRCGVLFPIFVIATLAELYVLMTIGSSIGAGNTILLVEIKNLFKFI
jgi:hypothetical protein